MSFNRKEEILDAFIKLAVQNGIDNTTMKDIADEVGISVGLIYVDYENKEELIDAFEERIYRRFAERGSQIIAYEIPADQKMVLLLVGIAETYSFEIRQNRGIYEFVSLDFIKYVKKKLRGKNLKLKKLMSEWITKIIHQGITETIFFVDNTQKTAELLVDAFGMFLVAPEIMTREHEEVIGHASNMAQLLLRAITNPINKVFFE